MSEEHEFEKKMKRLEEIVALLESGDISLEESLKLYREGMCCTRFCRGELDKARHEIEIWDNENAAATPAQELEEDDIGR